MDRFVVTLLIFVALSYVYCALSTDDPFVHTQYGNIRGVRTDKSLQFLGIPYAAPPLGHLRWARPQPPSRWDFDVYNATSRKAGCPQAYCTTYLPNSSCPTLMTEDCLYLNVWTPLHATNSSRYPVMVFIHGGSFKWGSGSTAMYDGNNVVFKGKVVLVNMDYRLGLLGFLYTGDGPFDAHGNYGIRDQRMALEWVQKNIAAFGGDPDKVTLFGQSAGAQSVFIHMMSSKAILLFRAAIMESSPFAIPYRTKKEALEITKKVGDILDCPERNMAECLRNKTWQDINMAQNKITLKITGHKLNEYYEPIGPIIDGDELTTQPMKAASTGKYQKMPIMIGTVTEEGRSFIYSAVKTNLSETEYRTALAIVHPSHFDLVEKFYSPEKELADYRRNLSQVITDYLFLCATRNVSKYLSDAIDVHTYVFDHASVTKGIWGKADFCEGHACHSEELRFVFDNDMGSNATEAEKNLSDTMMVFWTNFAHTMDPNEGLLPANLSWAPFTQNITNMLHFRTPASEVFSSYRDQFCEFWDSIGY